MALRRYTFKLYPTRTQEAALRDQARLCAILWNALLQMREDHYRRAKLRGEKKTSLTAFDQGKDITTLNQASRIDPDLAEWRSVPRGTQERVADMLDLAMKAFFNRAKGGAGASSGYPRFKSTMRAENIPLREPSKSCWRFTAHSGPVREDEAEAGRFLDISQDGSRTPKQQSWRLTLRGIPGPIKARGRFPIEPLAHKTADIKYHDGAWWFSICVEMPERRTAGAENLRVELDLIDQFAVVKTANGQCVSGLNDPFSNGRKSEIPKHDAGLQAIGCGDPANVGGAQVRGAAGGSRRGCGDPANVGGAQVEDVLANIVESCGDPANVGDAQVTMKDADALQSSRDRRYKRGSIRWRREKQRIARIKARKARSTKEALHRWTTEVVARARELSIIAPLVKQMTKTGRGNEQFHGAEVATVAMLNRHVLAMAPASAVQMLEYKAAEAGIACHVERREDHRICIGGDLRAAAVANKRAKRITKRKERKAA